MTNKLPSDTFCVLPWMHLATNPGGSLRVCCNSNPKTNRIIKDPETKKEYKDLVKKYHPDTSDPFFKKRNTKILQKLNQIKNKKDG